MNIKAIDAAIRAYTPTLSADDERRLSFFRTLWGVMDATSASAACQIADEKALAKAYRAGTPLFEVQAPVLDKTTLAGLAEKLVACTVEQQVFDEDLNNALVNTKWDRMVAASSIEDKLDDLATAISDFADLLVDDGKTEEQAQVGALLVALALRAQLEKPARELLHAARKGVKEDPHTLGCPVCGGDAAVARVGGETSSDGRGKTLWCPQCGTDWEFDRVRCARCGTRNQGHLHYFNIEGDEPHRIATCDECGGYIRTTYSDEVFGPFSFEVEDVVMARLDAIAQDPSFAGGEAQA